MGLVEQGHVERRIAALRARFLSVAVDREAVSDVLASPDIAAQSGAFARRWDGWRWRAALRFALAPLSLVGSNLNTPRLVGADIGYPNRVAERVKHSFDTLDMRREPALRWALTGAHGGDDALEAAEANWLSTAGLTALKANVPRMRVINARLAEVLDNPPPGGWTRFHIADALDELEPHRARRGAECANGELATGTSPHARPRTGQRDRARCAGQHARQRPRGRTRLVWGGCRVGARNAVTGAPSRPQVSGESPKGPQRPRRNG
jgi:hypothetical protein